MLGARLVPAVGVPKPGLRSVGLAPERLANFRAEPQEKGLPVVLQLHYIAIIYVYVYNVYCSYIYTCIYIYIYIVSKV